MQTDPNWSNFLYNPKTNRVGTFNTCPVPLNNTFIQIELIDFGASRRYSKEFMDKWYMLLQAAVDGDREACRDHSLNMGYITGQEGPVCHGIITFFQVWPDICPLGND